MRLTRRSNTILFAISLMCFLFCFGYAALAILNTAFFWFLFWLVLTIAFSQITAYFADRS
jgi:hypothetical protein